MGTDVTFSTRYPFSKIDSTNSNSFQIINIVFLADTPNPDGVSNLTNSTLVYQFAHGYKYVSSSWFLVSINGFVSALGTEGVRLVTALSPLFGTAYFVATVDSTNVNFYINKTWEQSTGFPAPSVLGITLSIRSYVFINDLSGNDVPSQP